MFSKILFRKFSSNSVPKGLSNGSLWQTQSFINGKFVGGDRKDTFSVRNPATGEVIANCPHMTEKDAKECGEVSMRAWQSWKKTTSRSRGEILQKFAQAMMKNQDDLARIMTLENGKALSESKGEIKYGASYVQWYAEEAKRIYGDITPADAPGKHLLTIKQSIGPVVIITPWNFPNAMLSRALGPALAAGCTVTIKPSSQTPLSALALCTIANEVGIPPGVMNVIAAAAPHTEDVGKELANSKNFRKLSFTGSTKAAKWLMRESVNNVKSLVLENGGNAPFIVFDDADLEVAVKATMGAKFRNAGQTCISANRIFVHDSIYEKYTEMLTKAVKELKVGDGLAEGTTIGPLTNKAGLEKVDKHVKDCVSKGGKVIIGGSPVHDLNQNGGSFYQPTIVTEVTKDMLPYREETFGPAAFLFRFSSEDEVIKMANDTDMGLAGYAVTKDLARAWRVSEALEVGLLGLNEGSISFAPVPFGGMKESGIGREGGRQGLEEYLEQKYICMGMGGK